LRLINSGILIAFLIMIALAVSGCSGGSGTATPTPTPVPGGYLTVTATPVPTPGTSGVSNAGQLYNTGNLNSYSYRQTSVMGGQTSTVTYSIGYTDATYNGVAARHTTYNYEMPASGDTPAAQFVIDVYASKADGSTLGGHMKMVAGGQTVLDMDIPTSQASTYRQYDVANTDRSGASTVTNAGTESVTVDGKTYMCTKYTYSAAGSTYTVWYTPQAPMPVKSQWTDDKGNSFTTELISWS
jgi:hypothetical protein